VCMVKELEARIPCHRSIPRIWILWVLVVNFRMARPPRRTVPRRVTRVDRVSMGIQVRVPSPCRRHTPFIRHNIIRTDTQRNLQAELPRRCTVCLRRRFPPQRQPPPRVQHSNKRRPVIARTCVRPCCRRMRRPVTSVTRWLRCRLSLIHRCTTKVPIGWATKGLAQRKVTSISVCTTRCRPPVRIWVLRIAAALATPIPGPMPARTPAASTAAVFWSTLRICSRTRCPSPLPRSRSPPRPYYLPCLNLLPVWALHLPVPSSGSKRSKWQIYPATHDTPHFRHVRDPAWACTYTSRHTHSSPVFAANLLEIFFCFKPRFVFGTALPLPHTHFVPPCSHQLTSLKPLLQALLAQSHLLTPTQIWLHSEFCRFRHKPPLINFSINLEHAPGSQFFSLH